MLIKDLRQKQDDELKMLVVQLRIQQMENRFQAAQGELTKTHLIRETRRLIAQVLTVLHERNLRMETKDYHRFSKIIIEENNKQAATEAAEAKTGLLDQVKTKLSGLKLKKQESDVQ
ncbi:large subunit ribosomal protein L29 [Mycoplasmoides fastidiosum]|uniref:Large ribosomal subunit protein uL29 n=2 Tax=Mycoplasmoides fastidiosum TaxID=92758 RepID=A0ABU0LY36_9BACT|nr:50S ribosomal protein L29 [Mycoplasmoides fastidiosum]MDQ0513626.1 large subunit ribosomal protein L29 [Mycoplasmoides fastidiosum]